MNNINNLVYYCHQTASVLHVELLELNAHKNLSQADPKRHESVLRAYSKMKLAYELALRAQRLTNIVPTAGPDERSRAALQIKDMIALIGQLRAEMRELTDGKFTVPMKIVWPASASPLQAVVDAPVPVSASSAPPQADAGAPVPVKVNHLAPQPAASASIAVSASSSGPQVGADAPAPVKHTGKHTRTEDESIKARKHARIEDKSDDAPQNLRPHGSAVRALMPLNSGSRLMPEHLRKMVDKCNKAWVGLVEYSRLTDHDTTACVTAAHKLHGINAACSLLYWFGTRRFLSHSEIVDGEFLRQLIQLEVIEACGDRHCCKCHTYE